jgi:hypothetical protein
VNWVYSPWGITEWPDRRDAWLKGTLAYDTELEETGQQKAPLVLLLEEVFPEYQKP